MAVFGNVIAGTNAVNAPPGGNKAVSPFVLDRQGIIDHLLFVFSGGPGNCMAVIYDNTGSGGGPGALIAVSAVQSSPGSGAVAFPFTTNPTLNAGTYWIGLLASSGGLAECQVATNAIAYNGDSISTGPTNPFGTPSLVSFQYPVAVFYTPVLAAGTAYGQLLGGDALAHNYLANNIVAFSTAIPVAGTISKFTTFIQNGYPGANMKGLLYDNTGSGGGPGSLIAATTAVNSPVINGNDMTFATGVHVAAGTYWFGIQTDTDILAYHRNDSTPNIFAAATYSSGPPSTFPSGTTSTGSWCLWATFAADAPTTKQPQIIICT